MNKTSIQWTEGGRPSDYILGLSGRSLGSFKAAAKKMGLSFEDYLARLDLGLKRCIRCRQWLNRERFGQEITRWDQLDPKCLECHRVMSREKYVPVPFDQVKPNGPPRLDPRDEDMTQAQQHINRDVKFGLRPHPNGFHCALCGHKGDDRRHEYHHHMGYSARHHYDVIPVCSLCHRAEHPRCKKQA